jgi:hypothetical protein
MVTRASANYDDVEIVAVNDPFTDLEYMVRATHAVLSATRENATALPGINSIACLSLTLDQQHCAHTVPTHARTHTHTYTHTHTHTHTHAHTHTYTHIHTHTHTHTSHHHYHHHLRRTCSSTTRRTVCTRAALRPRMASCGSMASQSPSSRRRCVCVVAVCVVVVQCSGHRDIHRVGTIATRWRVSRPVPSNAMRQSLTPHSIANSVSLSCTLTCFVSSSRTQPRSHGALLALRW